MEHLRSSKEFAGVLADSAKVRGRQIALFFKKTPHQKPLSVGIIASKKVAPLAVTRNRIRRIIYAYFKSKEKSLEPGIEIIVRLEKEIKCSKNKISGEIREELEGLLQKAHAIK